MCEGISGQEKLSSRVHYSLSYHVLCRGLSFVSGPMFWMAPKPCRMLAEMVGQILTIWCGMWTLGGTSDAGDGEMESAADLKMFLGLVAGRTFSFIFYMPNSM